MRMDKEVRHVLEHDRRIAEKKIAMIEASGELPESFDEENSPIGPVTTPERYAALMPAVAERNRRIAGRGSCAG